MRRGFDVGDATPPPIDEVNERRGDEPHGERSAVGDEMPRLPETPPAVSHRVALRVVKNGDGVKNQSIGGDREAPADQKKGRREDSPSSRLGHYLVIESRAHDSVVGITKRAGR